MCAGRFLLFFCLLFPSLLPAKPEEPKRASALRIGEKIRVDGRLDEPAWGKAEEISNFIQLQPERGRPTSFPSSAKVLYDDDYIYVGFSCQDKEPGKVIARLTKRDADLWEDDSITVFLDTFFDRRNCYYFSTNILGTQSDGRIVENGLTTDKTWDGMWKSAGQRTDFGWTAEVAIELASLKFKPGEERTWGFNVGRSVPRLFEHSFWAGPLESPYKVSQFG
ncbi:MAG: carbohydrate binding family 9 domain-containing protein, partial [Candidatus Aminicenantales bacterium]